MNDEASKISMRNQDRSIELLGEYTGKLLSRLDRINELVRRSFSLAAMLAAILSALASSGIFYIETVRSSSVEIERYFGPFIIGCLGILLVSLLAILSTRFSRNSYFYQTYEIAQILKKLIERTSQYNEHSSYSFRNSFEFDLRIIEAETALNAYHATFRSPGVRMLLIGQRHFFDRDMRQDNQ